MHLYIVRHGIAEDRAENHRDEDRVLTEEGKQKMREVAKGLKRMEPGLDHIFSSPLIRAKQTAEIIAAEWKKKIEILQELAPGHAAEQVCAALKKHRKESGVMVAGHEPNCSELVSYLLDSPGAVRMDFKKGAICLVETESLEMGSGSLLWHLSPKALRLMAD